MGESTSLVSTLSQSDVSGNVLETATDGLAQHYISRWSHGSPHLIKKYGLLDQEVLDKVLQHMSQLSTKDRYRGEKGETYHFYHFPIDKETLNSYPLLEFREKLWHGIVEFLEKIHFYAEKVENLRERINNIYLEAHTSVQCMPPSSYLNEFLEELNACPTSLDKSETSHIIVPVLHYLWPQPAPREAIKSNWSAGELIEQPDGVVSEDQFMKELEMQDSAGRCAGSLTYFIDRQSQPTYTLAIAPGWPIDCLTMPLDRGQSPWMRKYCGLSEEFVIDIMANARTKIDF